MLSEKIQKMCEDSYAQLGMPKYFTDPAMSKTVDVEGLSFKVQLNDTKKIYGDECPICNLSGKYLFRHEGYIWVPNKYPIARNHVIAASIEHIPQSYSEDMVKQMVGLAQAFTPYYVFYNGPDCGASISSHFHFQAVDKLPLSTFSMDYYPGKALQISGTKKEVMNYIDDVVKNGIQTGVWQNNEPSVNIIMRYNQDSLGEEYHADIFLRERYRPEFYHSEICEVAPATFEMAGIINTRSKRTFDIIDSDMIVRIMKNVCIIDSDYEKIKRAVK
jgi:hypothetical protein